MDSQKLENMLNLALDATPEELEKSETLRQGYIPEAGSWELIIRYSGSLSLLRDLGIPITELSSGYAIILIPEQLIPMLGKLPQIEYIEKPKRLFFAVNQAKTASCVNPVQTSALDLSGRGVLVAIIDSGIDYYHPDFRNEDGGTRILKLWDQTLDVVYDETQINQALETGSRAAARRLLPSVDASGHGTAVAGIAAGNGREGGIQNRGVAYESELLVVKLGISDTFGFPRTTQLMKALDFVMRQAQEYERPVAVNVSFGNTYGSHDGTSLLETFVDDLAASGRNVVVVGTGNEGDQGGHTSGILKMKEDAMISLSVGSFETGFNVQLWKHYIDRFSVSIVTPSGEIIGPISSRLGAQTITYAGTTILIYYGKPAPYSLAQEIYMEFLPIKNYLDSGIWTFRLTPQRLVNGAYDLWLPSSTVLNPSTKFLLPTPETTLTIPSTAARVVSVGAYNSAYQSYADFSGRGFTRVTNQVKPDLVAPGVNIVSTKAGGGYEAVTGTSFSTPFVTGAAALLMQWGVVNENDPYLYGQKVKAYLRSGAKQLPGFREWPNPQMGYGALCVRDSLPE